MMKPCEKPTSLEDDEARERVLKHIAKEDPRMLSAAVRTLHYSYLDGCWMFGWEVKARAEADVKHATLVWAEAVEELLEAEK